MEGDRSVASLVVGGTGMLAEATRWLAARSGVTIVVARRASRFGAGDPRFLPLDVDWNSGSFHEAVASALRTAPPLERALLWIHDPGEILPGLLPLLGEARVVLVLGSRRGVPTVPEGTQSRIVSVRLGSKPTADGRRWLTHEEISAGAIAALRDGRSRVVGELVPS